MTFARGGPGSPSSDDGDGPDGPPVTPDVQPDPDPGPRSATKGAAKRARRPTPWWQETLILIVTAVVLAIIIKTFFIQAFYIPSGSMENTLRVYDRILVEKPSYWFGTPQRGDIVVFKDPDHWLDQEETGAPPNALAKGLALIGLYPTGGHLVKRVIGIGGDHVQCKAGVLTVNGVVLHESSYVTLARRSCDSNFSVVVPPHELWVMGDNRNNSADSRAHLGDPGGGFIPDGDVVGKVFVVIWPVDHWRFFPRPSTFDQPGLQAAGVATGPAGLGLAGVALVPLAVRRRRRDQKRDR
ncbi:MAG TPA: signal peptidase I [Nocardioidaceae bacterium]|nr:signal peptidase I [Nocardioidaceae bacterium]